MKVYESMDQWIADSDAYLASLDQSKLGLIYAYSALADTFRYEYEREFFKRGYANNSTINFWLNLYRICRNTGDQLSAELFDIEEQS